MPTRVLLSVDTELTWRAHASGASWQENFRRSYEAAGVGVSWQLDLLRRHDLAACFFVDPMPAITFGIEPVKRMIAPILAAGQEVQLHLHPMWLNADRREDGAKRDFELTGLPADRQRGLIDQARELLRAAGAPDPIAFRAGAFGADDATLGALAAAGFRYDSTHNGSHQPWPCAIGLPARAVAPLATHGLVELPVMQTDQGRGRLRHCQIGALSFTEMRAALRHAGREGNPLVTIVSHSFEFATRDGSRVNHIVKRRFERLCALLDRERGRFPTTRIDALGDLVLDRAATPVPMGPVSRWARIAIQGAANLIYERTL